MWKAWRRASRLKPGEFLLVALPLLPQFGKDTGLGAHTVKRVLKGAELAGAILAHPLRGWDAAKGGYGFDVPLLPGDFVTTEAGTGFVHIAPGHGEDDFALGRAHGLPVPETVNDDGTFTAQAPGFAGLHVFKAHDAIYAACEAVGTLVAKGKLTHSYPHSWRSKKPVIFRATPQWFIALDGEHRIRERGARGDRRHALRARRRPQPHRQHGRVAARLVHQPPARLGRADRRLRRRSRAASRCATRPSWSASSAAFAEEGADAWYKPGAAAALPRPRPRRPPTTSR